VRHLNLFLLGSSLVSAACGARSGLDMLTASVGGATATGGVQSAGGAISAGGGRTQFGGSPASSWVTGLSTGGTASGGNASGGTFSTTGAGSSVCQLDSDCSSCGSCGDEAVCVQLRCIAGSCVCPAASTGKFACGSQSCTAYAQYCVKSLSDVDGVPDTYFCAPLPNGCFGQLATPNCDCLAGVACGCGTAAWCGWTCNTGPDPGALMVTCPGG
jgi:hypothetical protein